MNSANLTDELNTKRLLGIIKRSQSSEARQGNYIRLIRLVRLSKIKVLRQYDI
jgi:hypothetical protein